MDETCVLFENPSTKTITRKGEHTVSLVTTGHEKACVTVILCATSDGKKKKPQVIFTGKGTYHVLFFYNGSLILLMTLIMFMVLMYLYWFISGITASR